MAQFDDIIKDLKSGIYSPIYFLTGDEPYYIDKISDYIENNILNDEEKSFNQTIFFGLDSKLSNIIDSARRYPMMAERQIIIVKEAQQLDNLEALTPYIDHFQPTTILVFAYKNKKPDKRTTVIKMLTSSKNCIYFESNQLHDSKMGDWIINYCKSSNYKISPKASGLITESLGKDLSKIANELDKIFISLPQHSEVTEDIIEEYIGISKEFNSFELISAITNRDNLKAQRIVKYFESNPKSTPLVVTISTLFNHFTKLLTIHYEKRTTSNQQELARKIGINPYFIKDYLDSAQKYNALKCSNVISLLRDYDLKSKGRLNISDGELLRELVYRIIH